jgi:hypothetical protein
VPSFSPHHHSAKAEALRQPRPLICSPFRSKSMKLANPTNDGIHKGSYNKFKSSTAKKNNQKLELELYEMQLL